MQPKLCRSGYLGLELAAQVPPEHQQAAGYNPAPHHAYRDTGCCPGQGGDIMRGTRKVMCQFEITAPMGVCMQAA